MKSIAGCFSEVKNVFNKQLPADIYFDLSEIIEQYEDLKPEKALLAIPSWLDALDKVQCELGNFENEIFGKSCFTQKLKKLFSVPNDETSIKFRPKSQKFAIFNWEADIVCSEDNFEDIEKFAEFVSSVFTLEYIEELKCDLEFNCSASIHFEKQGKEFFLKKNGVNGWNSAAGTAPLEGCFECKVTLKTVSLVGHDFIGICPCNIFKVDGNFYQNADTRLLSLYSGEIFSRKGLSFKRKFLGGEELTIRIDTYDRKVQFICGQDSLSDQLPQGPVCFAFDIYYTNTSFKLEFRKL